MRDAQRGYIPTASLLLLLLTTRRGLAHICVHIAAVLRHLPVQRQRVRSDEMNRELLLVCTP